VTIILTNVMDRVNLTMDPQNVDISADLVTTTPLMMTDTLVRPYNLHLLILLSFDYCIHVGQSYISLNKTFV